VSFHPKMAYDATFHKSKRQLEDEGPAIVGGERGAHGEKRTALLHLRQRLSAATDPHGVAPKRAQRHRSPKVRCEGGHQPPPPLLIVPLPKTHLPSEQW